MPISQDDQRHRAVSLESLLGRRVAAGIGRAGRQARPLRLVAQRSSHSRRAEPRPLPERGAADEPVQKSSTSFQPSIAKTLVLLPLSHGSLPTRSLDLRWTSSCDVRQCVGVRAQPTVSSAHCRATATSSRCVNKARAQCQPRCSRGLVGDWRPSRSDWCWWLPSEDAGCIERQRSPLAGRTVGVVVAHAAGRDRPPKARDSTERARCRRARSDSDTSRDSAAHATTAGGVRTWRVRRSTARS